MPIARPMLLSLLMLVGLGCHHRGVSASLSQDDAAARAALDRMSSQPRPTPRPLVILGGYFDWADEHLARELTRYITPPRVIHIHFRDLDSGDDLDHARLHVLQRLRVEGLLAADGLSEPVDVIGFSMGGIVARLAALPRGEGRMQIARLFTICTPHQGADASLSLDAQQKQMAIDSELLRWLNAFDAKRPYPLVAYTIGNDPIVHPHRAAPPGVEPIVVGDVVGLNPHTACVKDPRLIADLARRLRGEVR